MRVTSGNRCEAIVAACVCLCMRDDNDPILQKLQQTLDGWMDGWSGRGDAIYIFQENNVKLAHRCVVFFFSPSFIRYCLFLNANVHRERYSNRHQNIQKEEKWEMKM